jgi:hypothetical protein
VVSEDPGTDLPGSFSQRPRGQREGGEARARWTPTHSPRDPDSREVLLEATRRQTVNLGFSDAPAAPSQGGDNGAVAWGRVGVWFTFFIVFDSFLRLSANASNLQLPPFLSQSSSPRSG